MKHATTWMKFKVVLSEISWLQSDKDKWLHLYEVSKAGKFTETGNRMTDARDEERQRRSYCLMDTKFQFGR